MKETSQNFINREYAILLILQVLLSLLNHYYLKKLLCQITSYTFHFYLRHDTPVWLSYKGSEDLGTGCIKRYIATTDSHTEKGHTYIADILVFLLQTCVLGLAL